MMTMEERYEQTRARRVAEAARDATATLRDAVHDSLADYKKAAGAEDAHAFADDLPDLVRQLAEQWCAENPF